MNWTEKALKILQPNDAATQAILSTGSGSPTSMVVLCHGFLSNKNSHTNTRLTELLVSLGIGTVRFDWVGMGESEEKFEDVTVSACIRQLDSILGFLVSEGYQNLGLIGSSFGGLISLLVSPNHPKIQTIGLKCPVPDFPELLEKEFGKEAMTVWKRTDTIPNILGGKDPISLKYSFYEDCSRFNAFESARMIMAPTLIVHGDQDELVPIHQILRLEKVLPNKKRLHLLEGGNHHFARPEDFRKMTTLLAEWMATHLSPHSIHPTG